MKTYFASPERASRHLLVEQIDMVGRSQLVSGMLRSTCGFLAVLNEQRQILTVNDAFLQMLGIDDPLEALGLRPGEVLNCIHAQGEPAGCGTTRYCATCGAAIAIVAGLEQEMPVKRTCALTANRRGRQVEMALLVRSQPITIEKEKFLLLLIHDITLQQQRAALERTFFHDINNMLATLVQASELLLDEIYSETAETIYRTALLLHREVDIQRSLSESGSGEYQPVWHEYTIRQIFAQLDAFFAHHPAAQHNHLKFIHSSEDYLLKTDISALLRVLNNMVINALEASHSVESVRVWVECQQQGLAFCVWNHQSIPDQVALRIFQRNFSTKGQAGRGLGTYSMKLFGEKILGGRISFTSTLEEGTIFRFVHPL